MQQRVGITLSIDRMLDSLEPMKLGTRSLHFGANSIDLGIYAACRLRMRDPHPMLQLSEVAIPTPSHFIELTVGLPQGEAITEGVSAAFFRRTSGSLHG
jgi:hypothetical protein